MSITVCDDWNERLNKSLDDLRKKFRLFCYKIDIGLLEKYSEIIEKDKYDTMCIILSRIYITDEDIIILFNEESNIIIYYDVKDSVIAKYEQDNISKIVTEYYDNLNIYNSVLFIDKYFKEDNMYFIRHECREYILSGLVKNIFLQKETAFVKYISDIYLNSMFKYEIEEYNKPLNHIKKFFKHNSKRSIFI